MIEQLTLDHGAARANDAGTSIAAAAKQRGGVPPLVVEALRYLGAATDDEIARAIPNVLPATVKSARSRLSKPDGPVEWTGDTRPGLVTESPQRVWRLRRRGVETVVSERVA